MRYSETLISGGRPQDAGHAGVPHGVAFLACDPADQRPVGNLSQRCPRKSFTAFSSMLPMLSLSCPGLHSYILYVAMPL